MLPVEFLNYADQIAKNNSLGPAEYRSAVSRAYYAVYHSAQAFLRAVKIEAWPAGVEFRISPLHRRRPCAN